MSRISSRLGFRAEDFEDSYLDIERPQFRPVPPAYNHYDDETIQSVLSTKAKKYPNFTDLRRSRELKDTKNKEYSPTQDEATSQEKRRNRERLAAEFAENTTLQGIGYIHRSRKWYRASFWLVVFLAAVGATTYQTYCVFYKYYSYRTTTSVEMGYAKLPFPTVTICNLNPIRRSMSSEFSEKLDNFVQSIAPKDDYGFAGFGGMAGMRIKRQIQCNPSDIECLTSEKGLPDEQTTARNIEADPTRLREDDIAETLADDVMLNPTKVLTNDKTPPAAEMTTTTTTTTTTKRTTTKESTTTTTTTATTTRSAYKRNMGEEKPKLQCHPEDPRCSLLSSPCDVTDFACQAKYPSLFGDSTLGDAFNFTSSYEKFNDYFDDIDDGVLNDDFYDDENDYGTGGVSKSLILSERLKEILSELSREERAELGHQAETMILDCEFNGRKCYYWDTVQHLSGDYGNCYSFNSVFKRSTPFKARNSGSTFGFTVILYIEGYEYIPYLSQGRGMRVVIHPFSTMPFATQSGKSVQPGEDTYIGLRLINMTRKGKPYGECGDDGHFTESFGYKYTVDGCINTCLARAVYTKCGCYLNTEPELYNPTWANESEPCQSDDQKKCVFKYRRKLELGKIDCRCNKACNTEEYNIEMSHNAWPDVSMWYELVSVVCERSQKACDSLRNSDIFSDRERQRVLRDNFLRVHVYFEDLNYQIIEEKPEYELEQFLSDIGGTMGLWVGASVITVVELIYFVAWLIARSLTKSR